VLSETQMKEISLRQSCTEAKEARFFVFFLLFVLRSQKCLTAHSRRIRQSGSRSFLSACEGSPAAVSEAAACGKREHPVIIEKEATAR